MNNWELEPWKETTQTSRVVYNHLPEITILNDRHICVSWLKMDSKLRGKNLPLRIRNSACFKANSYPNCLELDHFNRSPPSKQEPPEQTTWEGTSEWPFVFWTPTPKQLQSTPLLMTKRQVFWSRWFSKLDELLIYSFGNLWVTKCVHEPKQNRFHKLSNISFQLQGVKSGISVIIFKLFQFEVRFINSWQTGLPDFFIPK